MVGVCLTIDVIAGRDLQDQDVKLVSFFQNEDRNENLSEILLSA